MAKGKVSADLTAEAVAEIMGAIGALNRNLPFLISLSAEERKSLAKLGPKSVKLVQSIRTLVGQHPELVPPAIDLPEFVRDVDLVQGLDQFTPSLALIARGLEDTRMVAGSEALVSALVLYGIFKSSKRSVPGLDAVMDELGARFKRRARAKNAAAKV